METIVCIPTSNDGPETFRDQVLAVTNGKYLFAGQILMSVESKAGIICETHDPDPNIAEAFQIGGQGLISENDIATIKKHQSVMYLIWDQPGLAELHQLHTFINVCLKCGGLGVKFENSGVAHSTRSWQAMKFHENTLELLQSHVMLIGNEQHFYSTGMHIFGLPDAAVLTTIENRQAGYLLTEFNHYQLFESPDFEEGHTFSTSAEEPHFRLKKKSDWINVDEECFENPYGRFLLEPI